MSNVRFLYVMTYSMVLWLMVNFMRCLLVDAKQLTVSAVQVKRQDNQDAKRDHNDGLYDVLNHIFIPTISQTARH